MTLEQLNASDLEKIDRMQENLIAYHRIFAGLPEVTFTDEDYIWFFNSAGMESGNIMRTQISGPDIDGRIEQIINKIGRTTDRIDWLVFPSCRPLDLGKRLEARGMKGGPGGTWMLAHLKSLPPKPSVAGNFGVKYVNGVKMLEEWKRVSAAGFGGNVQSFYDAYARHGFGPDAFSLHYIGYLDDEPVTSATLLLAGGIAGIYDVSTPPSLRRRGFGGAITYATMEEAHNRGYQDVWIWSSPMGKSVYSKLGFIPGDFGVREYQWQKR